MGWNEYRILIADFFYHTGIFLSFPFPIVYNRMLMAPSLHVIHVKTGTVVNFFCLNI